MKLLHPNSGTQQECYFGECYHISNVFFFAKFIEHCFVTWVYQFADGREFSATVVLETIQGAFPHYMPVTISWASSLLPDQKHLLIRDSALSLRLSCPRVFLLWSEALSLALAAQGPQLRIRCCLPFLCGELLANYTGSSPLMGFK